MQCENGYTKPGVKGILCRKAKEPKENNMRSMAHALCGHQRFFALQQQVSQLGYQMDQCCCSIKTQMLQDKYDEVLRELAKEQSEKIASNTAAYVLSVTGKWVANAPAAAT